VSVKLNGRKTNPCIYRRACDAPSKHNEMDIHENMNNGIVSDNEQHQATPKVTVVILTINRPKYIAEALKSVREQSYTNYRIIVSDATDDPQFLSAYEVIYDEHRKAAPNNEFILRKPPQRLRQVGHFQSVLKTVDTEFVAILDDDDVWLPHQLQQSIEWLNQNPKNGLTMANAYNVDVDGEKIALRQRLDAIVPEPANCTAWMRLNLSSFFGTTSSLVLRTSAMKDCFYVENSLLDCQTAFNVAFARYYVKAFTEPSYLYRVHGESFYGSNAKQVELERHAWRIELAKRFGPFLSNRYPLFCLLAAKSAICLMQNKTAKLAGVGLTAA